MAFLNRKTLENIPMYEDGFVSVDEETRKRIGMEELPKVEDVYARLFALEKILGKTYDVKRLKELIKADREGRIIIVPETLYVIKKWCNCDSLQSCSSCTDKIEEVKEIKTSELSKRALCILMSKLGVTTFYDEETAKTRLKEN